MKSTWTTISALEKIVCEVINILKYDSRDSIGMVHEEFRDNYAKCIKKRHPTVSIVFS